MYLSLFSTSGLAFFFHQPILLSILSFPNYILLFSHSVVSDSLYPMDCSIPGLPQFSSVHFSCSVISDSLQSHGLQHARPPCPSPATGACSNSCPLSRWCHPTISSSVVPFSSCLQSFPASGSFSSESVVHIRWPKYWSFSFSPSDEYSGVISFRMEWFDLLAVQDAPGKSVPSGGFRVSTDYYYPVSEMETEKVSGGELPA